MTQTIPIQIQRSAGGVAFRIIAGRIEVVLISVGMEMRWQLPKGMLAMGESDEQAARREVHEEAGIITEILAPLEQIDYWYGASFRGNRVRIHKYVTFFLMRYLSGNPQDHDHEVNEACWFEINQAIQQLTYDNERRQVMLALNLIQKSQ